MRLYRGSHLPDATLHSSNILSYLVTLGKSDPRGSVTLGKSDPRDMLGELRSLRQAPIRQRDAKLCLHDWYLWLEASLRFS